MQDIMRGLGVLNSTSTELRANTSSQEFDSTGTAGNIFATGFNQTGLSASATYIYITIRRGPMKTPTSGTSVFSPNTATTNIQSGRSFPPLGFLLICKLAIGAMVRMELMQQIVLEAVRITSRSLPARKGLRCLLLTA